MYLLLFMMNFNHLYYFYLSHKLGGVTKAAQYLRISQSSLSVQIKSLEDFFDTSLFYKSGRYLYLTENGHKIFAFAENIFNQTDEFLQTWKTAKTTVKRKIILGISPQVERPFAASLLSQIIKEIYKSISIEIAAGTDQELNSRLDVGAIDLLLTNNSIYQEHILQIATLSMPVKLYLSAKVYKSLKLSYHFNMKDFFNTIDLPFILPSESFLFRREIDSYLKSLKIEPQTAMISDILSVIERTIFTGAGFSFMPANYIRGGLNQKQIVALGKPNGLWTHQIHLYARKELANAIVTEKIAEALKNESIA